jgi:hypothetical protein
MAYQREPDSLPTMQATNPCTGPGLQRKSSVPGNDASRLANRRRFTSSAWEQRKIVVLFAVERQYLEIHPNTEQLFVSSIRMIRGVARSFN